MMADSSGNPGTTSAEFGGRLRDDEIDLYGITHVGKVRKENQDHFLIATVHPQLVIHETSLPTPDSLALRGTRLATVMLVADGVGGSTGGREASQLAIEAITKYVSSSLRSYHAAGSAHEGEFIDAVRAAAQEAHVAVRAQAAQRPESSKMATTLTMMIAVWPWAYVVQVGDSRCYYYDGQTLNQLTRDQTIAQDLVDQGVLSVDRVAKSPFSHVLASAIGADEALPVVSRVQYGSTMTPCFLLCTDGLTKHVNNDEIRDVLSAHGTSEETSRRLLELALERGGTDNVTVLIAQRKRI